MMNFYLVHWVTPNDDATDFTRKLMGKFVIDGDKVEILSDYHDFLHRLLPENGVIDQKVDRRLESMFHSSYLQVTNKNEGDTDPVQAAKDLGIHDPNGGSALPDAAAIVDSRAVSKPQPVFDYQRVGMDQPHTVEIRGGQVTLDGNLLSAEEAQAILKNVQTGVATLRYRAPLVNLAKAESAPPRTRNIAMTMERMRASVQAGHMSQEDYDDVRSEMYNDEMVPSIGNKRAYREHVAAAQGGVHIMLDANDFKSINDDLSHQHGDDAIKAMGTAMRSAVDKTVGPENAKIHRFGGDEFHVHVPTHEHAATFLRTLRQHLEAVPPIGGTHALSMSAGIGHDVASADHALNVGAKGAKKNAVAALGGDPHARVSLRAPHALYAHSAVKGFEGPVPTGPEQLPVHPPVVPPVTPLRPTAAPVPSPTAPTPAAK